MTIWKYLISTTTAPISAKLDRLMTYLDRFLAIKPLDPLITWSCEITWQTRIIISPLPWSYIATKLGRVVTFLNGLVPIKLHGSWVTWSCKITWQIKKIISPLLQFLCLPSLAGWQLIIRDSHNVTWPLITWPCEITWQIKQVISPLALNHWIEKMTMWQLTVRGFHP